MAGQGIQLIEIYAGGVTVGGGTGYRYDENVDIFAGFSNTNATNYIRVLGMVSHVGLRDYGIIIKGVNPGAGHLVVFQTCAYTKLENLGITATSGWNGGATIALWPKGVSTRCKKLFVHDLNPNAASQAIGYYHNNVGDNQWLENCAFVNLTGAGSVSLYFLRNNNHKVYNCSILRVTNQGIIFNACTITITNTIVGYTGVKDYLLQAGANATVTYCISEDDTADDWGGVGNLINKVMADQFVSVTPGSEDIHLKAGADCIDAGVDLSGTFTGDIDGDTRTGTWDVGADELIDEGVGLGPYVHQTFANQYEPGAWR